MYVSQVFYANLNVCTISTAFISLNRAIAIWNYDWAEKIFSWKKTLAIYAFLWMYSLGFFIILGKSEYYEETISCTFARVPFTNYKDLQVNMRRKY